MNFLKTLFGGSKPPALEPLAPAASTLKPATNRIEIPGRTALINAAAEGDVNQVKALIAEGTDKEARDDFGMTALHVAALHGHPPVVEALVRASANLEAEDLIGQTALQIAVRQNESAVVDILRTAGASITQSEITQHTKQKAQLASMVSAKTRLKPSLVLNGHSGAAWCVAISHEGFEAVSGGADKTLRFWNIYDGKKLRTVDVGVPVQQVCYFENDCKILAQCGDGFIRSYEPNGTLLAQIDGVGDTEPPTPPNIQGFARIPATCNVIFGTGNLDDWQLRFSRDGAPWEHRWNSDLGFITAVAVSPDASWFVAADAGGRLAVWDLTSGNPDPLCYAESDQAVHSLATYRQQIIAGHTDGSISIWDTEPERLADPEPEDDEPSPLPEKEMTMEEFARWMDDDVMEEFHRSKQEETEPCPVLTAPVQILRGHRKDVSSLAVEGSRLLSGSLDNTLLLWDLSSGDCLALMEGPRSNAAGVLDVAIRLGSGRRVVSSHGDGSICVWDTTFVI